MKVVLINPPMIFKKMLGEYEKLMEPMPCMGLAYMAAVLEKEDIDIRVIDAVAENWDVEEVMSEIKRIDPDIVGISCLTPSAKTSYELSRRIKEYNPNILRVFGNIHAEIFAEEIIKRDIADVVVKGEGEYTMLELTKAFERGEEFSKIKGIVFKKNGKIIETPSREPITNLDELPYPAWHLFPYEKYGALPFTDIKKPMLGVMASRSCPFRCAFCSAKKLGYRKRDPKKVVDEIEFLIEEYNAKQITFMDLIFPLDKKHATQICEEMIERGINEKIVWATETRADVVDEELLKKMKKAGCKIVMYGIESGSQRILDRINKKLTLESIRRAVRESKKTGLITVGFFMIGLPGETKKDIEKTIKFAKSVGLDFAKFAIFVPFPGSPIFNELIRNNELDLTQLKEDDWIRFSPHNPDPDSLIYVPKGLTKRDICKLKEKATIEFYTSPKNIFNLLFRVRILSPKHILEGVRILLSQILKGNI